MMVGRQVMAGRSWEDGGEAVGTGAGWEESLYCIPRLYKIYDNCATEVA